MLTFAMCDDNISVLNRLAKILESIFVKHDINATISFTTSNPKEIIDFVENNTVNVLFLDINLNSNINGCDIADIVRKKNKDVYIIFTTAHLEYALIAYKYKTFDYLPKPIVKEKLEETILRLVDDVYKSPTKFIRLNNNKTIIIQNDINYIKKDGMKLIFCTNSRDYQTYGSFSKITSCLPDNFVRCHKSYIVNIKNIVNVEYNKNSIVFAHNNSCSIGAKYKNEFLGVLKNGNVTNNLDSTND